MKYGLIRITALSPEIALGHPQENASRTLALAQAAQKAAGGQLALMLFPQLNLTGATCGRLFEQPALLSAARAALLRVAAEARTLDAVLVVGLPVAVEGKVYACQAALCDGRVLGIVPVHAPHSGLASPDSAHDTALPWAHGAPFSRSLIFSAQDNAHFTFAIESQPWPLRRPDAPALADAGVPLVLWPFTEPAVAGGRQALCRTLCDLSARSGATILACAGGDGESTTDHVFDTAALLCSHGLAQALDPSGQVADLYRALPREGASASFRVPMRKTAHTPDRTPYLPAPEQRAEFLERILCIQSQALARRAAHIRAKTLVVNVSGGLDSAVALLVARRAAQSMNPAPAIHALTLPGFGTSTRTRANAQILMDQLADVTHELSIGEACRQHLAQIGATEALSLTYENAQARERTQILLDYANLVEGLAVGSGDLSEIALGFSTFGGDHLAAYDVNAGVPKTVMQHLIQHEAERLGGTLGTALLDVRSTPISPELLPPEAGDIRQKTEEILGPYLLNDFFLYHLLVRPSSLARVAHLAQLAFAEDFAPQAIRAWLRQFVRRFVTQQFKRNCSPDGCDPLGLSLSPRSFLMPSDAHADALLAELDAL